MIARTGRHGLYWLLGAFLALALDPSSANADPIVGQSTVIDGDTIEIHGQRIRLAGMDAFETGQRCRDTGAKIYSCGQNAAFALDALIGQQTVTCETTGRSWDRLVAQCSAGRVDLGWWMVRHGYAVDDDRYQPSYAAAEEAARWQARGAWAGSFERPRVWRDGQ